MTMRRSASIDSLTGSIQCASSMMNSAGVVRASDTVLIRAVNRRRRASGSMAGSGTSGSAMPSRSSSSSRSCGSASAGTRARNSRAGGVAVEISHAAARPQQPRHGVKRDVTSMRLAENPKHLDPATGRQRRGLPGHPALADARRSHHGHDSTAATDRAVHQGVERGHLPVPSDEVRVGAPNQAIAWADRDQPVCAHRFVSPFDAHRLRVGQNHSMLDESRGRFRQHHPAGRRHRFHPLREPDRLADRAIPQRPGTDRTGDHPTRIQPYSQPQRHAVAARPPRRRTLLPPPGWPARPDIPEKRDLPRQLGRRRAPSPRRR